MVEMQRSVVVGEPASITSSIRRASQRAAPAVGAFVAVKLLGLATLTAFATAVDQRAHHVLTSWDAQWYAGIARDGYGFVRVHDDGRLLSDYAFFPLYPFLERVVAQVTGLPYVDAGLAVSWLASVAAAWAIFAVADQLYGRRAGLLVTVLWAALPVSIVQSMAYSESLFTALAAWSLYAVLTERWLWAGLLACLAGMTRPVGAAVVAAVVVAVLLKGLRIVREDPSGPTSRSTLPRLVLAAVLAPAGWFGYVGWVGLQTGSPTGYFTVTSHWGNTVDGGSAFAAWISEFLVSADFLLGVTICLGLALLGWLFALCVQDRQPLPLLVFSGLLILVALSTSGYFGSKPRYLLPAFPLLMPVALWLARRSLPVVLSVLGLLATASAIYGGVWRLGPGPP